MFNYSIARVIDKIQKIWFIIPNFLEGKHDYGKSLEGTEDWRCPGGQGSGGMAGGRHLGSWGSVCHPAGRVFPGYGFAVGHRAVC